MTLDQIVTVIGLLSIGVGALANAAVQSPWVQDRPGLKRLMNGASLAAGRIAQTLPPGTSAAQAEVLISNEVVKVASKYADSAKVSGSTQVEIRDMIAGELGKMVPAGHIAASLPPAAQDAVTSFMADIKAALIAQAAAAPAAPSALSVAADPAAPIPAGA